MGTIESNVKIVFRTFFSLKVDRFTLNDHGQRPILYHIVEYFIGGNTPFFSDNL